MRGIFEDMIKEFNANVTRFEIDFVLVTLSEGLVALATAAVRLA